MAGELLQLFEPAPYGAGERIAARARQVRTGKPLRPYQQDAALGIRHQLGKVRSTLLVLPTGCGKTRTFADVAATWPGRVFVVAHRRELLYQARDTLVELTGEDVGLEQAENFAGGERLVVASVDTLRSEKRRARFHIPPSLIIIDEAHHATADGYLRLLKQWPDAKVLGVTATPDRTDKEALGQVFETEAYRLEIEKAIADGWLAPIRPKKPKSIELDIRGVKTTRGDLDEKQLDQVMREHVKQLAQGTVEAIEEIGRPKAIVFCTRVETAHDMASAINDELGQQAAVAIDGEMADDQRAEILGAFRRGERKYLINVGIATEGFDDPAATACVICRPTKSRALFTQMCGRVLRPLPGVVDGPETAAERRAAIAASDKPRAWIVNFKYIAGRHHLVCPEDILGGKYTIEERERAKRIADEDNVDVDQALEQAREQLDGEAREKEAERKRRAEELAAMEAKTRVEWGTFNLFQDRPDFDEEGNPFYAQPVRTTPEPATGKQINYLKYYFKVPPWMIPSTKAEAGKLIGQLKAERQRRAG